MKAAPGLIFTFDDGREIALPCPTAERMAAVFALTPASVSAETAEQFIARLIRQADTLLETAAWTAEPFAAQPWTRPISAADLTLSQARQFTNACLAHFAGTDAAAFTREIEASVADRAPGDLQAIPLGKLLELFRNR